MGQYCGIPCPAHEDSLGLHANPENHRLNLELAKKPPECLEYIILHEMIHIFEPIHNNRFVDLMDKHITKWRFYREELNCLPVRHEEWTY